jgi:tetratricopeptide (TPR) repeat protein
MTCDEVHDRDLVAEYVHRRLSEQQRDEFEQHFLDCESCFAGVQEYRLMRHELASAPAAVVAEKQAWWRLPAPTLVFASAAAVLLVAVIAFQTSGPGPQDTLSNAGSDNASARPGLVPPTPAPTPSAVPTRVQLVAQLARYEPPDYRQPELRGAEPDTTFVTAMGRYRDGDYRTAVTMLREVLRANESGEALFYLGISNLESGEHAAGLAALRRVIALGDPIYEEDARFYVSKALLQVLDVAGARAELERVAALQGDRAREARELIAAIDQLPAA